jgi:hypothetical protein
MTILTPSEFGEGVRSERESAIADAVAVFTTISPTVQRIELDTPWTWLAAGWRARRRAPRVSLARGVVPCR